MLPGGAAARLRSIEVHDRAVTAAAAGRVALNLAGAEREDVPRGACIVRAGDGWETSDLLVHLLTGAATRWVRVPRLPGSDGEDDWLCPACAADLDRLTESNTQRITEL